MKISKKIISLMLSLAMLMSFVGVFASNNTAYAAISDYIYQDAHGNAYANFPDEYPTDLIGTLSKSDFKRVLEGLMDETNGLTKDEKLKMLSADGLLGADTSGQKEERSFGTGIWYGVPRVGIPAIRMYDGPMGVRGNTGYETTRPSNEVSIAAAFDTEVAYINGLMYGRDEKAQSGNMQLGSQNDIIRTLSTSRQRDMFGEDWYLSGTTTAAMTYGMQEENTIACLKHFGNIGNADEQTLHEMYLSSTETAIKEGSTALAIMTAYGTVNGVQDCMDEYLLIDVARDMWDFKGIFITDWGGNYTFTTSKGVTIETPNTGYNSPEAIQEAIDNGEIDWDFVDQQVYYILYTLNELGYLGLVYMGRNGIASDDDPPMLIELPGVLTGDEREALLTEDQEAALEMATKGAVLLKNDNGALPLTEDEDIALIGMGSTYLIAGHHHECSFGSLRGLSYSPTDGLRDAMPGATIQNYVYDDIAGVAVPAEYLYVDAEGTENGVVRVGTDGYGNEVNVVDDNIDFVTNSITYKNAADGNAFEYGEQGHHYTWTTYLKAPETGTYDLKVEAIAAPTTIKGTITIDEVKTSTDEEGNTTETVVASEKKIAAAAGDTSIGTFGNTNTVATSTGMDIPKASSGGGGCGGGAASDPENVEFDLEEGKLYKVTVEADGAYSDAYDYQRGVKDMQVRLAWLTPSQKTANHDDAMTAAGTAGKTVVLFAYELDGGNDLPSAQISFLDEAVAAAKAAGNKIVLVLSTAVAVDITKYVDDVDAILEMWLPGQAGGAAIGNILSGKVSPSGKLSVTWPTNDDYDQRQINTNGRGISAWGISGSGMASMGAVSTELKEGIFVGYKWYDAAGLQDQVLWDFGYGLTYTDFDYELVGIEPAVSGVDTYGYDVTVKVTNVGTAAGSQAPQVYIGGASSIKGETVYTTPQEVADSWHYTYNDVAGQTDDDGNPLEGNSKYADYFPVIDGVQQAKYQLAGWARTDVLEPGESEEVTIHVDQRALSYWDVDSELIERADGTRDKYVVIEVEDEMAYKSADATLNGRDFYIATSSDIDNDLIAHEVVDVQPAADAPVNPNAGAEVVIGNVEAEPGDTVDIDVELRNSNGIAGYLIYIECDNEYVSIVDIADGGATYGGHYEIRQTENGYKVLWSSSTNATADGIIFTIVAQVSEDAPDGVYPITATYSEENTGDENSQPIAITIVDGSVTVKKIIPGDLNGDGKVNNMDIIMLARYLVNLTEFNDAQLKAADFDLDGSVNNTDLVAMARYVVELF